MHRKLIGHDVTHEENPDEGGEVGDVYVEVEGKCVVLSAYYEGEEWAKWQHRYKKIDCGTEGNALSFYQVLAEGGDEAIESLAEIYKEPVGEIMIWFRQAS